MDASTRKPLLRAIGWLVLAFAFGAALGWVTFERSLWALSESFADMWRAAGAGGEPVLNYRSVQASKVNLSLAAGSLLVAPAAAVLSWLQASRKRGVSLRPLMAALPVVAYFVGAVLAYRFALAGIVEYLIGFPVGGIEVDGAPVTVTPFVMLDDHVRLVAHVVLTGGLMFGVPVFVFLAHLAGVVPSKQVVRYLPHVAAVAAVAAWLMTPGGSGAAIFTLLLLAGAFAVGFGAARLVKPSQSKPA